MTADALQLGGGLASLVATMLAWGVSTWRLPRERTHFISEVLALPWWCEDLDDRGSVGSLLASALYGAGALAFVVAAALSLRAGVSLAALSSAATGVLLFGIIVFPLRQVPQTREGIAAARGLDLMHPFLAAVFYLSAMVSGVLVSWPGAGLAGQVLVGLHLASSLALTTTVLVLSPRVLGPAAYRPWYLPGVRILLDTRDHSQTDTIRWLQWPATVLVALDLGLAPLLQS